MELAIPTGNSNSPPGTSSKIHVVEITIPRKASNIIHPEVPRVLISCVFMVISFFTSSIIVIIIHDRYLDRDRHPPLPDRILDNVPYMEWALLISEYLLFSLGLIFWTMLLFHKKRAVVARRFFIIVGVVIYLRCPCLIFTSLPVSSEKLICDPKLNDTTISKFERATTLFLKLGMSVQGVQTCGDFMFSGHVAALTVLNLFIFEYSPFTILRILAFLITAAAITFMMLGKAHYTIDILVTLYTSFIYFHYYHVIVKYHDPRSVVSIRNVLPPNSFLKHCYVRERFIIWIPLFGFLERTTSGVELVNEFENPFPMFRVSLKHLARVVTRTKS